MADLRGYYDVNDEANSGAEVLPAGIYTVKITNSGMKDTKKGNGKYLFFEMAVVDGDYIGSIFVERLNVDNPNKEAVRIARGQFAALREAVGVLDPKDSVNLHGIRFQIALKCVPRKDDPDKMENRIQRYIKRGENITTPQQNGGTAPYARSSGPNPAASSPGVPPSSDCPF